MDNSWKLHRLIIKQGWSTDVSTFQCLAEGTCTPNWRSTPNIQGRLWLIDWFLNFYRFTSRSKIFQSNGDVTIAGERLQDLGLCSVLRAFEQEGISIVTHLSWHGASAFPVSSEGPPHLVASYNTWVDADYLF
jgi:hypothetical protein